MPMLELKRLTVQLGAKRIVDGLSFSVSEGQWLMIVGPNGAGKSTVLSAVTQGVPYQGEILFEGTRVSSMKPAARARSIGILSQNHFVGYSFTVEEVVRLGRFAYSAGLFGRQQTDDRAMVERAITMTGLQDKRSQSVLTLSGGELQRTFLAQVLAQEKSLMQDENAVEELDQMQKTTAAICEWLEGHPESLPKARRFAEYYIPTTLKLLHTYNDVQGQQGENAANIRRDIAGILHTLNQAYRNLYDTLLGDAALDVSSEIAALQGMLANDGLTGGDFQ